MTTIDHRILIPAAPDLVWNYISDVSHNPDWQIDCREVVFLTSRREGPGLRWRYSTSSGDRVVAVTAWYNGLGYEYYFVDGVPFRENKGRLRLQEIPEGTIVQWTFHYELGGLLGGVRNAISLNRQVDHTIAESLRTLWQQMKQSGATAQEHEAKSLMRDAPDVNARSTYQPRHPSAAQEGQKQPHETEPPINADDAQRIHIIDEPPIAEDDTRQRQRVLETSTEPANIPADLEGEPEFLTRLDDYSRFEPPRDPSDTQPRKAVELPAEPSAPTPAQTPSVASIEPPAPAIEKPSQQETEPLVLDAPPTETTPLVRPPELVEYLRTRNQPQPEQETKPEPLTTSIYEAPSAPTVPPPPATAEPVTPATPVEPKAASAPPSIWEVFGLPRPSETQETASVSAPPPAAPPVELELPAEATTPVAVELPKVEPTPEAQVEAAVVPVLVEPAVLLTDTQAIKFPPASSRVGLRIALRRRLVRIRRP